MKYTLVRSQEAPLDEGVCEGGGLDSEMVAGGVPMEIEEEVGEGEAGGEVGEVVRETSVEEEVGAKLSGFEGVTRPDEDSLAGV